MKTLPLALLVLLLAGCDYSKALATLETADHVRALTDQRQKTISSTAEIVRLSHMLATPRRDWQQYVVDEPVSPQQMRFYRGGKEIARVGIAKGWIIIDFFTSPRYPAISSPLSEEYQRLVSSIWKHTGT